MMLYVPSAFHQQIVSDFAYQALSVSWKHTKVSLSEENYAFIKMYYSWNLTLKTVGDLKNRN